MAGENLRKPSWKRRITSVSKKLVSTEAIVSEQAATKELSKRERDISDRERQDGKKDYRRPRGRRIVELVEAEREREPGRTVDWHIAEERCVLNGNELSSKAFVVAPREQEDRDREKDRDRDVPTPTRAKVRGEKVRAAMDQVDHHSERTRGSRKGDAHKSDSPASRSSSGPGGLHAHSHSHSHSHAQSGGLGPRKSSFGSRLKPEGGGKNARPSSPQLSHSPVQRRSSGRKNTKLDVLDAAEGLGQSPPPRSASPNRSSSFSRRKANSSNPPSRTGSPNPTERRHDSGHSSLVKQQNSNGGRSDTSSSLLKHHQNNGKSGRASPASPSAAASVSSESAFAKVRDTLRIRKPKSKTKKKKGMAYSVSPVEIFTPPSKYQDPFEVAPSFTDSSETIPATQTHDFKSVSIPHNKPEYCDHCGETAWGLYRQVLKCSKCDFIVHRKCEAKVNIDCSSRLEQAVLHHDKQVEDCTIIEEEDIKHKDVNFEVEIVPRVSLISEPDSTTTTSTSSSSSSSQHSTNPQVLSEKAKLAKKIRDYNKKTTPVHHIHIKGAHVHKEGSIEYQGFVRVHMCVQRPIHVSTAITRTSWYRLMRPVKERNEDAGLETAFYLPTDTNRLVHINNFATTKELVQILLKKFCVTDNPKKFSLYEEYGGDCRRLFEEDNPLVIVLEASVTNRNSKLVLRDNTYSTIQWEAFSQPELNNFIQILRREEDLYVEKLEERFRVWKYCITQTMKEKCREEISRQTYIGKDGVCNGTSSSSSILDSRIKA